MNFLHFKHPLIEIKIDDIQIIYFLIETFNSNKLKIYSLLLQKLQ